MFTVVLFTGRCYLTAGILHGIMFWEEFAQVCFAKCGNTVSPRSAHGHNTIIELFMPDFNGKKTLLASSCLGHSQD